MVALDGTRAIPTVIVGDTELVSVDDLAAIFGVLVRDDALARAITVGYKGRTIVVSQDQALASIGGRLVSAAGGAGTRSAGAGTCRWSSSAARCRPSTTCRSSCGKPAGW